MRHLSMLRQRLRGEVAGVRSTMRSLRASLRDSAVFPSPSHENTVFGPVPSRRLGRSLGINTIPSKICSYACVYCQAGQTCCRSICRQAYLDPYELFSIADKRIEKLIDQKVPIDYISLMPNGEPTLDLRMRETIHLLREFGHKIAVFTNSSLLWNESVRESLDSADYVSVKVDTVNEATWLRINRPHSRLKFDLVLEGIVEFAKSFRGVLTTETMFVKNMNDTSTEVRDLAGYLATVKRTKSYFTIPIRPPVELYAVSPDKATLSRLSQYVKDTVPRSEMLCRSEGSVFDGTGEVKEALMGILAVHPMTAAAVIDFLKKKREGKDTLRGMVDNKLVHPVDFGGTTFYVKTTSTPQGIEQTHHE
jgi:wyosine [tRNA(Phe)-imidazoG37] synthetase (radical SAM superfamily)